MRTYAGVTPQNLWVAGRVDDDGLSRKVQAVKTALNATSAVTPTEAIQQIGGREVAAMFGAIGRAAEKGIAVLVDGYVVAAAALALIRHTPKPLLRLVVVPQEQGHGAVLDALGAKRS